MFGFIIVLRMLVMQSRQPFLNHLRLEKTVIDKLE